jgi:hypothetical protein
VPALVALNVVFLQCKRFSSTPDFFKVIVMQISESDLQRLTEFDIPIWPYNRPEENAEARHFQVA